MINIIGSKTIFNKEKIKTARTGRIAFFSYRYTKLRKLIIKDNKNEKVKLLTLAACLLPSLSFAHNLTLNKEVPSVSIEQYGEIFFLKTQLQPIKAGILNNLKEKFEYCRQ